jgi:formiminotetrahydrofolate cyclodeaminase
VELYEKLGLLEAVSATSMSSDLRVGQLMAAAGARAALANVAINLEALTDASYVATMRSRLAALEARLAGLTKAASR